MMHLHEHHIIHRDLKPHNILLDDNFEPHITDFGFSKFVTSNKSSLQSQTGGTSIYMASEMIEGLNYNGKVDVYSFAILMYEVVTDCVPYPKFQKGKMTEFKFHQKVVNEDYRPTFNVPVKKTIKNLIEKCWSKDPKKRPIFQEIFNRLANNIENSVYDVFESDSEGKYYLKDADSDEIFFYVEKINSNDNNNETIEQLRQRVSKLENHSKESDKIIEKLSTENKNLREEINKLKEQNLKKKQ